MPKVGTELKDYAKTVKSLNDDMIRCIELEIEQPGLNCKQLAEKMHKSYMTVYGWLRSPIYREERDKRLKEAWSASIKLAQKTIIDLAKNGDRQAAQYILSSCGYDAEQNVNVKGNGINITIDYGDDQTESEL